MPSVAAAQATQLSGRAWADDGSPIEGAVAELHPVADSTLAVYTLTNELGFFSFRDLQPGTYALTVTRIGFEEHREEVSVTAGTTEVEVIMAGEAVVLEGVTVEAERSRAKTRFEESAGITVQEIEASDLKSIPVLIESDPLRAVEVLPGVTTVSDFSGSYNVRGGSADQNLILLDEVPIFNPFHLGNIFSVFNADMVDRVELQSGGYPAEYGGRVSSVLTIASDPGDGLFGVDAGISLLATRVAVKEAVFPFARFANVDPILGPEMRSTGEVMGWDDDFGTAFLKALIGAGVSLPTSGTAFVSVRDGDKPDIIDSVKSLVDMGFSIIATRGTAAHLREHGIDAKTVKKVLEGKPNIVDEILSGTVDLVFNTAAEAQSRKDSKSIRRTALTQNVPYLTTSSSSRAAVQAIRAIREKPLAVRSLQKA